MKTIGYVLADFPVLSETFIGNEMRVVGSFGHQVIPIVMHLREGPAQQEDRDLVQSARLPCRVASRSALAMSLTPSQEAPRAIRFLGNQRKLTKRSLFWNAMKIAVIARRSGCRHLHAHFAGGAAAHAIVAAHWLGVPISFTVHGHDVYATREDLGLKLSGADRIVCPCRDIADDLARIAPGAGIETIPCGVDPNYFHPEPAVERMARFLFIGRLVEQKGLDDLLSALSLNIQLSADIVGDGPLRHALEARAAALGLQGRVRFLGPKTREWMKKEARRYLALVAPFKIAPNGARDTGPIVVKEAMAMGLPVITTNFMGNKETVTSNCGMLVDVSAPAEIASAMSRILTLSEADRIAMGARGRQRILDHFSLERQGSALSTLFESL